jgi:hypothetical protein
MVLILGGLVIVSIASFAMTFLFWSSQLPEKNNILVGFLGGFVLLFGPACAVIGLLLMVPFLPEACVSLTIPLMIPAVFVPWIVGAFGAACGDLLRERLKK